MTGYVAAVIACIHHLDDVYRDVVKTLLGVLQTSEDKPVAVPGSPAEQRARLADEALEWALEEPDTAGFTDADALERLSRRLRMRDWTAVAAWALELARREEEARP